MTFVYIYLSDNTQTLVWHFEKAYVLFHHWVDPEYYTRNIFIVDNTALLCPRAAVVNLNFRAGSTFPVAVCTVPSSMDRTSRCNKVDAVRLYASYRLNLLLLKGQRCVCIWGVDFFIISLKKGSAHKFQKFLKIYFS